MKKIKFLIVFLLLVGFTAKSQPPPDGSNVLNPELDKFEGTWIWSDGSKTLTLMLKKVNHNFGNYSKDVLYGVHQWVTPAGVIEDNLGNFSLLATDYKKSSVLLSQFPTTNILDVIGSIDDLTKHQTHHLTLLFVAGSPNTIVWRLKPSERTTIDENPVYGTTLPRYAVLTKQ